MNEQLQKQLADMLAKLTSVAQDAGKFAADQIPPLVQEKIVLGRIEETIYVLTGFVLLVVVLPKVLRKAWNSAIELGNAPYNADGVPLAKTILSIVASFALGAAGAALFFANLHDCLMAWLAPRLYIVEWLTRMVTK